MSNHKNITLQNHFCGVFRALKLGLLGSFLGFTLSQCEKKQETPPWDNAAKEAKVKVQTTEPVTVDSSDTSSTSNQQTTPNAHQGPLRFVAYNIRNYLQMRRGSKVSEKPAAEISDLIANIIRANPDVLGLCEIGGEKDIADLQTRLKHAGCDLPYSFIAPSADPVRRLGMLSKTPLSPHPIAPKSLHYKLSGQEMELRRGILDVSIQTSIGEIRFLGAHLKSKRPMDGFDQALIRRNEALLLRKHASTLLKNSSIKLLVYGDMNDTKRSSPIRTIKGPSKGSQALQPIELRAKNGTKWTQYWAAEDIYSRFDFAFTSTALRPHIDHKSSSILDTPRGDKASDHRALIIVIKGQ